MAVKQKTSEVILIMNHGASTGYFVYIISNDVLLCFRFSFFCNKYEVFHYLPGTNLYCLSCL